MQVFFSFLRLIRIKNLLVIASTMYAVRYGILFPLLSVNTMPLQLPHSLFFLLVLSTVMIAASGYIINDYFDIKIDKINKPGRVIVGRQIKRRVAMGAHIVINVLALLLALAVAYQVNFLRLAFIQFLSAGLLWYYSVSFKRQAFLGNIVVAFLAACVPFVAGIYDLLLLHVNAPDVLLPFSAGLQEQEYTMLLLSYKNSLNNMFHWVAAYAVFAFLLTLAREVVKDCEDYAGDNAFNCKTIPITYGFARAHYIIASLLLSTGVLLIMYTKWQFQAGNAFFMLYSSIFIQFPLLWLVYKTLYAYRKQDYTRISSYLKWVMLAGICYLPVLYYFVRYA